MIDPRARALELVAESDARPICVDEAMIAALLYVGDQLARLAMAVEGDGDDREVAAGTD